MPFALSFFADLGIVEGRYSGRIDAEGLREALLLPVVEPAVRNVQFWETACRNRGLDVRCFQRREDAVDWLLQN